jgi:hypothetical protein
MSSNLYNMKKLIPFIILLSVASTGLAWPFGKKEPKTQPTSAVVAKPVPTPTPKPTISGSRELLKELSDELKAAKQQNENLKGSLTRANDKVTRAEAKTLEVQKAADALKEWGIIQQAEAQKFMQRYNDAVKRYHRLKVIAAIIAAAGGVLLGLQFMALVPPPYNLGIPVGGAALFATLVWLFL